MKEKKYTVSVLTLGCRVNQYESDSFTDSLKKRGVEFVRFGEKCDLAIVNTCTVTAESDRKSRQMIRRALASAGHTVVTGCFAQISADYFNKDDGVTFVTGNSGKAALADTVYKILCDEYDGNKINVTPPNDMGAVQMTVDTPMRCRSYVKIEDGCDNRCSYCIISTARGPVRSKPVDTVIKEVSAFAKAGCREVILTGIETASYGMDFETRRPYGHALADLITEISKIEGIRRIGLGSLEPTVMSDYFVDTVRKSKKVLPHFHLSIQSGSSKVLASMRRRYNADMALSAIEKMKNALPDATFSADVIVGFPGETEENFSETVEFCRRANFLHMHIFPYSKRAGTEAAEMKDQIPEDTKKERLRKLSVLGNEIKNKLLSNYVNEHTDLPVYVLVEECKNGHAIGHSEHFVEVELPDTATSPGEILPVLLVKTNGDTVCGKVK